MSLISTFEELADGRAELLKLLNDIGGALPLQEEADICHSVISLTCKNVQEPLVGQALLECLASRFDAGCNPPDLLSLAQAVDERIDQLLEIENQRSHSPSIIAFLQETVITQEHRDRFPELAHVGAS